MVGSAVATRSLLAAMKKIEMGGINKLFRPNALSDDVFTTRIYDRPYRLAVSDMAGVADYEHLERFAYERADVVLCIKLGAESSSPLRDVLQKLNIRPDHRPQCVGIAMSQATDPLKSYNQPRQDYFCCGIDTIAGVQAILQEVSQCPRGWVYGGLLAHPTANVSSFRPFFHTVVFLGQWRRASPCPHH
jgi:hypothetical protein